MDKEKLRKLAMDFKYSGVKAGSESEKEIYYNLFKLIEALLEEV